MSRVTLEEKRGLEWSPALHRWTRRDMLELATEDMPDVPASVAMPPEGSVAAASRNDPMAWNPATHSYLGVSAAPFDAADYGMDPAASPIANAIALNAAIVAANAVGGVVHVPPGAYVTNPITPKSNTMVYGDSHGVTTLTLGPNQTGSPNLINAASGLTNVIFRNMTLDGGSKTYTETDRNHIAAVPNGSNVLFQNVTFQHARREAFSGSGQDITLWMCNVQSVGQHGIWFSTGTGVTSKRMSVLDSTVLDWGQNTGVGGAYGIIAQASAAATATGDSIEFMRNHVEMVTGSAGAGSCIYVAGGQSNTDGHTYLSHYVKVEGNTCLKAGLGNAGYTGAAIEVAMNCPGFSVQHNTVDGSIFDGISYGSGTGSGANDATVTGGIIGHNIVTNCLGAAGIEVEGTNLAIVGNQCLGNSGHGIYVAGVNSAIGTFIAGTGGHLVASNSCWLNGNNGITFVDCPNTAFLSNVCANNGTVSGGGIVFQTQAADFEVTGCFFDGNQCFDTRSGAARTQLTGINTSAAAAGSLCDGNRFGVNDCHNNKTVDIILNMNPTTPDVMAPSNRAAALAFAAGINLDAASYDEFTLTLTGNVTSSTFSQGGDGRVIRVALTQDGTGGRTFAWPSSFSFPAATAPNLSGAGKTDVFTFQYSFAASKWREIAASQNMA